jgi:two-component system response regulator AtoC
LRERKDDTVATAEFLMKKHAKPGAALPVITPSLKQAFLNYDWPGNVRELENVVRKFLVLRDPEMIVRELHREAKPPSHASLLRAASAEDDSQAEATILEQVTNAKQRAERTVILAALNSTHWNRKKAAILLKIDYKALLYKMKVLGIEDKMPLVSEAEPDSDQSGTQPLARRAAQS